jgi:ERCC4-related helicase
LNSFWTLFVCWALQMFMNDVKTGTCPSSRLALLVVDECHHTLGESSMVQVSTECKLQPQNSIYSRRTKQG